MLFHEYHKIWFIFWVETQLLYSIKKIASFESFIYPDNLIIFDFNDCTEFLKSNRCLSTKSFSSAEKRTLEVCTILIPLIFHDFWLFEKLFSYLLFFGKTKNRSSKISSSFIESCSVTSNKNIKDFYASWFLPTLIVSEPTHLASIRDEI